MRGTRPTLRLAMSLLCAAALAALAPARVTAQQQAQGFAADRLFFAPPGSAWVSIDDLGHPPGLGAAASFAVAYAHAPLRVQSADGASRLTVIEHETVSSLALAVTYDRLRLHVRFLSPIYVSGQGGTVDGWQFTAPNATTALRPDTINDLHLGLDVRILGGATDPIRVGASAELLFPSGFAYDYLTDGTYRGIVRVLLAGGSDRFQYGGHVGVHVRPLDQSSPGGPRGSELLFGLAAGPLLPVGRGAVLVGAELCGATPFQAFLRASTTALEARLTASYLAPFPLRVKASAGPGFGQQFGAPEWRALLQVETQGTVD